MLHYTDHARDRMKQRNISRQKVEACINNPDETYPDNVDKDCKSYVRTFPDGRRIRVVVNEDNPAQKVVITAIEQGDWHENKIRPPS